MRKDPKEQWKQWYSQPSNRELVSRQKKAFRESPSTRPVYLAQLRKQNLRKLGWCPESYEGAWQSQHGRCAICGVEMTRDIKATGVAADHCHERRQRRQLLCMLCNKGLGNFRDSPALLRAAAAYLERHA